MADGNKTQLYEFIKSLCEKMDREAFEKLISDQPVDIRAKGVLLFNGCVSCAEEYRKKASVSTQRNWEAAQAALEKFSAQLEASGKERPLLTLADVLEYLSPEWRISRNTLYRHHKEGKLLPLADGTYAIRDVEKYARTFLKQKSTGMRLNEKVDELQRRKLELELRSLELEHKSKQHKFDRDIGLYVPKEQMERDLAMRAGILDAGLKHWVRANAADWVRLTEGNMQRVGELISKMGRDLDELMNSYASSDEIDVVIDDKEDMEES